jgi:hypothetical protein
MIADVLRAAPAVIVEPQGGLGNQKFQYAAGHALAQRTGSELRLDLSYFDLNHKRRYLLDCYGVPAKSHSAQAQVPLIGRWRSWAALRGNSGGQSLRSTAAVWFTGSRAFMRVNLAAIL